ncbi:FTR1 family iron permease [Vibrio viridaestus]|uniref:FTR1 family iron permease n=1 Tax=Vibrio viridaestus TaxID=2487322 RepID=A0A3N9TBR7_9VIBR|nr:FTR1 family protein [Vibrio viridaestus]RQW61244.1 FTR1 family iron permease [Vibrio viridaestus]
MSSLKIRFVIILSILFAPALVFAQSTDYQAQVNELTQRLDKVVSLYKNGHQQEAKTTVQMAYFEVFEGIEGPIRINYSQQYSYKLEAQFGDIRKAITQGNSVPDVENKVSALQDELNTLPEKLAEGHQLVAESRNSTDNNVVPYWQDTLQSIDDLLADAVYSYRTGNAQQAHDDIQKAQFTGYKNSELETAIRLNVSAQKASEYNDSFKKLLTLVKSEDNLVEIGYETTSLVQDLSDDLAKLPASSSPHTAQSTSPAESEQSSDTDWHNVQSTIMSKLKDAVAEYKKTNPQRAIADVQDVYFDHFEASGMENSIGARDSAFKTTLEGYFTRLVSLMNAGQSEDKLTEQLDKLNQDLDKAVSMLTDTQQQSFWALLLASFTIIVREGLEALLIVAAIVSYLVKNKHEDKLYVIKNSVWVGLGASLITAALFQWIFENAGASREMLEGVTMLIAVFILFSMSYWLLAKVEANRWKLYLENKLSHSITKGSLYGLWLASFLAVYREGAETVLFYYALGSNGSHQALLAIFAGLAIGIVVLAICYFIMRYSVVRLPLKPFFMFTGSFMYLMAFSFSGNGVLELIEAKLFQPTLINSFPEISWLGIHPYIETLVPQVILLVAALIALWVMKRPNTTLNTISNTPSN